MLEKILRRLRNYLFFIIFRVRIFTRQKAKEIAASVKDGDKILEVGSGGKNEKGEYYFSAEKYFRNKNVEFIMSDINPKFGHKILDISDFNEENQYDHILCFHVLDEVYNWEKAFLNLYNALKANGHLHIILPVFSPLPRDSTSLFRFTERLLKDFCFKNKIQIEKFEILGFRIYPFAYYLKIKKQHVRD